MYPIPQLLIAQQKSVQERLDCADSQSFKISSMTLSRTSLFSISGITDRDDLIFLRIIFLNSLTELLSRSSFSLSADRT